MLSNDNNSQKTGLMDRLLLCLSGIVTVLTLAWVLWYCRYGFDFTDEGFYLVWMSNPFKYNVSATQFGFIYHPLYNLLDGNISALRQANVVITYCLAWMLCGIFLKTVYAEQSLQHVPRIIISAAIATASLISLVFAGLWLPTPSYNSLALQALLVVATGLLLADRHVSRISISGWFLIGIGGWLAFMAKPTTAAALGLCSGIYLLLADKLRVRLIAISVATAASLIIFSIFVIDGSLIVFIDRLRSGIMLLNILGGHSFNKLIRLDEFYFDRTMKVIFIFNMAAILSTVYLSHAQNRALRCSGVILTIFMALASMAMILVVTNKTIIAGSFLGLMLLPVPIASILVGIARHRLRGLYQIPRSICSVALIFFVFPYAYAFGTGNNYWVSEALAGIFWVLAGLVFLNPLVTERRFVALLLPIVFAVQFITIAIVYSGIESPYRQPQPLRFNDYKLEIGRPGSMLVLSKGFASYLNAVNDLALQSGFKKGMPMIDLTGQSPGVLYALGASNIGQPWIIGGYPGSDALAVTSLQMVSCQELATAWLLTEPGGSISISPGILSSFGANMAVDFEVIGTFKTAEGSGGYKAARVQQLLKPLRTENSALTACTASRQVIK